MLISFKHRVSPLWLWVPGFQLRCLSISNEICSVCSTGVLVSVQKILFCTSVIYIGNCVKWVASQV